MFPYQYQVDDRIVLHLPQGYHVENLPKPAEADAGALTYNAAWKQEGSAVTLTRRFALKTSFIQAAQYAPLRTFYGEMGNSDRAPLVLKKE